MTNENESLTFHNENAISRIALWANIVGVTILAFSLIGFAQQAYQLITNWDQIAPGLPASYFERLAIFATQVFMDPLIGAFYFLVLRGVSELLNLGRDLYYGEEEMVAMEEVDAD